MESSCFGDPSTELAAALHENNLRLFCDILAGEDIDVNAEMPHHGFSSILHMAVLAGKTAFVTEILRHREANPNQPHRTEKRYPIHVAAETAQVDIMELLVRCGADVNAKMENGSTALHVLAVRSAARWEKEQDPEETKRRFVAAVRFLANQPGVLVDAMNNIGVTPLYFAAEKGTEGVARVLLEAGASISIEVDGDTVENLLVEKMPELYKSVDLRRNRRAGAGDTIENKLFPLLYLEAQTPGKFIPAWHDAEQNNNKVDVNADNGTYTFLQYSCDQGLAKVCIAEIFYSFLLNNSTKVL
jgi:ankyrin repeat protein